MQQATLVMACPLAEPRMRWIRGLRERYAVHDITERRALEQVLAELRPEVLVIDLAFLGLHRVRGLREMQRLSQATKIVVLTETTAEDEGAYAVKAGARGYCARNLAPEELIKAVAAVQRGEIWASRQLVRRVIDELVCLIGSPRTQSPPARLDPRLENLTARQRVVADLIRCGASNKEIGKRLNISERTVKAHLTEAFRHAGVSDRLQLALLLQGNSSAAGDD